MRFSTFHNPVNVREQYHMGSGSGVYKQGVFANDYILFSESGLKN